MRCFAASWWSDVAHACASRTPCRRWCRRSSSPPPASVIGVVVAEISTGLRGGIGRLIVEYAQQATGDPAKLFTAIFGAAVARPRDGRDRVASFEDVADAQPAARRRSGVSEADGRRRRGRRRRQGVQPGHDARRSTPSSTSTSPSRAGEFVSLIGPSGCGKSTLLRLSPTSSSRPRATIRVNGKPAAAARLDQDYGMAFQQAGLFDWRTVVKNVELPLELKGWDKAERRQRAMEMLQLVKLGDFAEHRPWQLSGGMQQRVAIARALAAHPAAAADGRAVRRPRRDDPRAHADRAAADLRRDRHERRVRHPLDPRGRLPVRPRRRDVAAPGPHHPRRRHRPRSPTATIDTREDAGVLQEGHRGARGAARPRGRRSRRGVPAMEDR